MAHADTTHRQKTSCRILLSLIICSTHVVPTCRILKLSLHMIPKPGNALSTFELVNFVNSAVKATTFAVVLHPCPSIAPKPGLPQSQVYDTTDFRGVADSTALSIWGYIGPTALVKLDK